MAHTVQLFTIVSPVPFARCSFILLPRWGTIADTSKKTKMQFTTVKLALCWDTLLTNVYGSIKLHFFSM